MHYPQCNGLWRLEPDAHQRRPDRCRLSLSAGAWVQPRPGRLPEAGRTRRPGPIPGAPVTARFDNQSVGSGQEKSLRAVCRCRGDGVRGDHDAGASPAGDPDLYVRFGPPPTRLGHDCRPYLSGAKERCAIDVPRGRDTAFVMVRGSHTAPTISALPMRRWRRRCHPRPTERSLATFRGSQVPRTSSGAVTFRTARLLRSY